MPPEFIKESELWGSLFALGVFGALVLAAAIVQVAFKFILKRRLVSQPDALDIQVLQTIRGPLVLFLLILGLFLGFITLTGLTSNTFDTLDGWDKWARRVWGLVLVAEVAYLATHLTQVLMAWYLRHISTRTATSLDEKLLPAVKRVLPMVIYAVAALVALDSLDVSISPMLAGLGIGGLAVALAVQPTLSNFFAGTYLVTEGELKEGDFIELEGGPAGYVVDVGWRSTKIRSRFNNLVIIPNSKMADTIVTNYYSPVPSMNVIVTCGVSYDSDLAQVERVVMEMAREVVAETPEAVNDIEPRMGFSSFGDSNIDFWVFAQATDRGGTFALKTELVKRIHQRFKDEGIEINYPVRKLVYPTPDGRPAVLHPQESLSEPASSDDGT